MTPRVRELTAAECARLQELAHSPRGPERMLQRARIIWHSHQGLRPDAVAQLLNVGPDRVRFWIRRFNAEGLPGLADRARSGRPETYAPEQVAAVLAIAHTDPRSLGLPFGAWTLDRLAAYLDEHKQIAIKRSRIRDLLAADRQYQNQET